MNETDTKAARRAAAAGPSGLDRAEYEETKFGWRRISRIPKPLLALFGLAAFPVLFLYRRFSSSRRP